MPAQPSFRFDAKSGLFTYAQSGTLTREQVREHFKQLGADKFCIGKELHTTGDPHIHAYVEWEHPFRTRDVRTFDIGEYHPNIRCPRSRIGAIRYVTKEDKTPLDNTGGANPDVYEEALMANSGEEFMRTIRRRRPRDFCLYNDKLRALSEDLWPKPPMSVLNTRKFNTPPELNKWYLENVVRPQRGKIVRGGPSPLPSQASEYILSCL